MRFTCYDVDTATCSRCKTRYTRPLSKARDEAVCGHRKALARMPLDRVTDEQAARIMVSVEGMS